VAPSPLKEKTVSSLKPPLTCTVVLRPSLLLCPNFDVQRPGSLPSLNSDCFELSVQAQQVDSGFGGALSSSGPFFLDLGLDADDSCGFCIGSSLFLLLDVVFWLLISAALGGAPRHLGAFFSLLRTSRRLFAFEVEGVSTCWLIFLGTVTFRFLRVGTPYECRNLLW